MSAPVLYFVYGTLKSDGPRNEILLRYEAELVGKREIVCGFTLYDLGAFPAMVPSRGDSVRGEIWSAPFGEQNARLLAHLDWFENVNAGLYRRALVATSLGPAWSYVWAQSTGGMRRIGRVWPER